MPENSAFPTWGAMNTRRNVSLFAGVILGNMIAERFVLKTDSGGGFVPVTDGLGMDEIARAASILAASFAIDFALSKVWK